MSIAQRTAWLQKHPTPLAQAGEFHWYPAADGAPDRDLRSAFVERMRGKAAPFALWHVARGVVAWAQAFGATAPSDGRHYVGLVVTIAEGDAPISALLASLAPPAAAPWTPATAASTPPPRDPCAAAGSRAVDRAAAAERSPASAVAAVRALLSGGAARVASPDSPALPVWLAAFERALEAHLPPVGAVRSGAFEVADAVADATAATAAATATAAAATAAAAVDPAAVLGGADPVAQLCAAAATAGGFADIGEIKAAGAADARVAAAWRLACELAGSRDALDGIGAAAAQLAATGDARSVLTPAEQERAGDARRVPEILHAWGRGRLDDAGGALTLPARLAELVAWRALALLAEGRDANAALAEARWQALLPAARRSALFAALVQRAPSLRGLALLPARDAIAVAHRMEVTHA